MIFGKLENIPWSEITGLHWRGKVITGFYTKTATIWKLVSSLSCFGRGFWEYDKGWSYDEGWKYYD